MAEPPPPDDQHFSRDQVDWFVESRAAIEQAKGVLMFIYRFDADQAFEVIRSQARRDRVNLRLLAEQFVDDVTALTPEERRDLRAACRRVLLTAHQRIHRPPGGITE